MAAQPGGGLPERCVPCEGGVPPLGPDAALDAATHVPSWELDYPFLRRRWTFPDFAEALAFVNRVGAVAEEQGHHPDVYLTSYRELELVLTTHAIDGLSLNDFVLAREIDRLEA
jgi:4a-hydroxytetrahydrobiopterin dehydratase